ncbi:hypothetical protein N9W00_00260 [Arcobacteraceae bacterium]|nr:hypothetical protein [Arcobacteraceae bacterium]
MKKVLLGSALAASLLFASNVAQINVNNDTLEVGGELYLNNAYNVNNSSNYYFTINYLGTEADTNAPSQKLLSAGLKVLNPFTDDNGISLGIGMKSVYTNQFSKTFFALPLAAYIKYEVNEMIYVDLEASYAPKVLSFSDADNYRDTKIKVNYKVLEDGYAFIGARDITTKYEMTGKVNYDTSAFIGYEVKF